MENPHMQEQVLEVLDKLRPFLLRDGGDVELVDIEEGIVKLRLMGACGRRPSSTITLKLVSNAHYLKKYQALSK